MHTRQNLNPHWNVDEYGRGLSNPLVNASPASCSGASLPRVFRPRGRLSSQLQASAHRSQSTAPHGPENRGGSPAPGRDHPDAQLRHTYCSCYHKGKSLPLSQLYSEAPMILHLPLQSDAISTLEKEHDYREEHFDFIQQHIRKFCLNCILSVHWICCFESWDWVSLCSQFWSLTVCLDGAALFYTSVRDDKNCDLLYKYLGHRIYGFPFTAPAQVVERDAVFMWVGSSVMVCYSVLNDSPVLYNDTGLLHYIMVHYIAL